VVGRRSHTAGRLARWPRAVSRPGSGGAAQGDPPLCSTALCETRSQLLGFLHRRTADLERKHSRRARPRLRPIPSVPWVRRLAGSRQAPEGI